MPALAWPYSSTPQPHSKADSTKRRPPWFSHSWFTVMSLATKTSVWPLPSKSAPTTPKPLPKASFSPASLLTSVNVPSPLLRNSTSGAAAL